MNVHSFYLGDGLRKRNRLSHLLQQIKTRALLAAFGLALLILFTTLGLAFTGDTTAIGFNANDALLF